jgi:hypothetical protein
MSNTNSRFVLDINRIVRVQQGKQSNIQDTQAEPIASTRGVGVKTELESTTAGIVSPLKEIGSLREYYDTEFVTSSDGLFVIERQAIKKAVFADANGDEMVVEFSLPS